MDRLILLYSHCVIVKGAVRATVCDLQRHEVYIIPNTFADLFTDNRYLEADKIVVQLDVEEKEVLSEYLDFLLGLELAFYCSEQELELFPKMPEQWLMPAHISHCVLDATDSLPYFDKAFLDQLAGLCCNFIQFRFYGRPGLQYLHELLGLIHESQVKSVELLLPYQAGASFEQEVIDLVNANRKIACLTLHGANKNCILKEGEFRMGFVVKTTERISDHSHCGVIQSGLFSISIPTYMESLSHNSCLNRKVSIDKSGNIKNCPSMKESYGNVKDTTLADAIEKTGFKKYWNITKDQVSVCRDCEFRHVCTDCRAYLEDPDDMYSKPLKCGYNPYTCKWEEWSTNPLKQHAIRHYQYS